MAPSPYLETIGSLTMKRSLEVYGRTSGSALLGCRATVDHQLAARHIRRFVRREVEDAVGDFIRRADTSHREPAETLLPGGSVLQHVLDHVGRDRSGVNGVTTDVFFRVLDGRRLGEESH